MSTSYDIVVIDDSATIRKLIDLSMRGSSFRPHFAQSGAEGVARVRALLPSAILLDCVLPDIAGIEVCRQLAADPTTRSIPILLITARARSARDEFRELASVVDFIGKPFTGPDLLARIGRAIGKPAAAPRRFTHEQHERAARILYARLRDGFALVPSYMSQLGVSPPAPFFAKRLLTPEVMETLLHELSELCAEVTAAEAAAADQAERDAPTLPTTAVLDRAPGFSDRVRHARLDSPARRVLTLIDGRNTLADIGQRTGMEVPAICKIAHDLVVSGLLRDRTSAAHAARRPVVILEPDVQGFQRPLASMLEMRPEPHALVAVGSFDEMFAAAHRMHPCLLLINATREKSGVGDAARQLRSDAALPDFAMVAVLDPDDRSNADDLYSAGFDAVLSKPIIFGELERFIEPGVQR